MGAALAVCRELEAEARCGSLAVPFDKEHAPETPDMSHGDFPADLHGMRRRLPDEWAGFLKKHFNSDVRTIRAFFDCDEKTVRDWLSGKHGVNGAPLLKLIRENSAARQFFLGEAA